MKLPPEWKAFYLRSLQVPVLGRGLFGPLLRGIWKVIQLVSREPARAPQAADGLLTTYASTIHSLRLQVEGLERRSQALESELEGVRLESEAVRESARVQVLLLSAGVQSLLRRVEEQGERMEFQRRAISAALSGLDRRAQIDAAPSRKGTRSGLCN